MPDWLILIILAAWIFIGYRSDLQMEANAKVKGIPYPAAAVLAAYTITPPMVVLAAIFGLAVGVAKKARRPE